MNPVRLLIVVVGMRLPYAMRILSGPAWVMPYMSEGVAGFLFLRAFNAIALGNLIALSRVIRRLAALRISCALGFGFLAWAHATLDLSADAQAGIALVFIPIHALLPIARGGLVGIVVDRRLACDDTGD